MVVVHPGDVVLPELGPELGACAQKKLQSPHDARIKNIRHRGTGA